MDRRSLSLRRPAVVWSLILLSIVAVGCKSGLESFALLYEGYDIPAEWDNLKGKKVVVVCKLLTGDEFSNAAAARTLTEIVCENLKTRVKDIHVIESQKVNKLLDEKGIDDYLEIGKALKADKVVGIDIQSFSVLDGQTLFRGRSQVKIRVYDVAEKHEEWHKSPPEILYPSLASTPTTDCTEIEFRNRFLAVIAEQIGRCFYPHDRHEDTARDATIIQ